MYSNTEFAISAGDESMDTFLFEGLRVSRSSLTHVNVSSVCLSLESQRLHGREGECCGNIVGTWPVVQRSAVSAGSWPKTAS